MFAEKSKTLALTCGEMPRHHTGCGALVVMEMVCGAMEWRQTSCGLLDVEEIACGMMPRRRCFNGGPMHHRLMGLLEDFLDLRPPASLTCRHRRVKGTVRIFIMHHPLIKNFPHKVYTRVSDLYYQKRRF